MTERSTYTVTRPVYHDDTLRRPGSTLQLTEEQASPLTGLGHITPGEPKLVVVAPAAPVALGLSTLSKLTVGELQAYAVAHGVDLQAATTKEQILTAIEAKGALSVVVA